MDGDDNARILYALIVVGLLVASLSARRLPMTQILKMFLAWVAIFAVIFVMMSFRPEMKMIWDRVSGEITGAPRQSVDGKEIRLTRQDDGHFWLRAKLNGHEADMMVDSGASFSAINGKTAQEAGLTLDPVDQAVELNTANGMVKAQTATVKLLTVGDLVLKDHNVVVSDSFGDTNVVGMNFLDGFESWNVAGDVMTLRI